MRSTTIISNTRRFDKEESELKVKYLINVVSMMHVGSQKQRFPGCIFASPQELIGEALEIGYNGVQAIPVRGIDGEEEGVLLYEDAWNAVDSLWSGLRHHTGSEGMPACLNDWVVSPRQAECARVSARFAERGIPKVVHHFGKPDEILEINSGINMPIKDIRQKCFDLRMTVCIDSLHLDEYIADRIRRGEYAQKSFLTSSWSEAVHDIVQTLGDLITVIHVHYKAKPTTEVHEGTVYTSLITEIVLRRFPPEGEVTLVAEYNPGIANLLRHGKIRIMAEKALEDMRRAVKDALSDRDLNGADLREST